MLDRCDHLFIDQVFPKVKRRIKGIFSANKSVTGEFKRDPERYASEACSFLPEVYQKYEFGQSHTETRFINFATNRCIFNLIDNYRSVYKEASARKPKAQKDLHQEHDRQLKQKGYCDDAHILDKVHSPKRPIFFNSSQQNVFKEQDGDIDLLDTAVSQKDISTHSFQELEWEDWKRNILKRCKVKFVEEGKPKDVIYYRLVRDYLLPKCENRDVRLCDLAKEQGLSVGRLSQLIKDGKISRLIFKDGF